MGTEKEEKSVKDLIQTMDQLWAWVMEHDEDGSGTIDELEFRSLMSVKATARILNSMDVDVEGLVNVAPFIFGQEADGKLCRHKFLKMVLDLRGSKKATVKDHVETRKFLHGQVHDAVSKALTKNTYKGNNDFSPLVDEL